MVPLTRPAGAGHPLRPGDGLTEFEIALPVDVEHSYRLLADQALDLYLNRFSKRFA